MTYKKKLFLILWLAGFAGILSLLLLDFNALARMAPRPESGEVLTIGTWLKLLSLIQPSVLVAVAVLAGIGLAPKVGLSAPVAEAVAAGKNAGAPLRRQIVPGILGGIAGGISIVVIAALFVPWLPTGAADRISEYTSLLPLVTRVLSGGITEEVLLRWGLMTSLVWLMWRLLQGGEGSPKARYFVAANLLSAFLFGLGHLPIAVMLFPEPTAALVMFVLIGNSAFGGVAGFLFWRRGLESAMIAHIVAHLIMYAASRYEMYF